MNAQNVVDVNNALIPPEITPLITLSHILCFMFSLFGRKKGFVNSFDLFENAVVVFVDL